MHFPFGMPMAIAAASFLLPDKRQAGAEADAVTSASVIVSVTNVTDTSARLEYTRDKYDYGTRTLCYDTVPLEPQRNCATRPAEGNEGAFPMSGLRPGTRYNFRWEAEAPNGRARPYAATGTFSTLAAEVGLRARPAAGAAHAGLPHRDALGRAREGESRASGTIPIFARPGPARND